MLQKNFSKIETTQKRDAYVICPVSIFDIIFTFWRFEGVLEILSKINVVQRAPIFFINDL